MAVIKDAETTQEAKITINNGDLKALNEIKEKYQLKDGTDVITFALGVLSQGGGRPITIEKETGEMVKLLPSDKIKRVSEDQ